MSDSRHQQPYIYVRGLRQVDHTVFCVENGQKTYFEPTFERRIPYSSGQQVKRSILDQMAKLLGEGRAPTTFNWTVKRTSGKVEWEQREPWSPCDPTYADQLIGGWMRAQQGGTTVKRRSPLSISAMRPLHPSLAGLSEESVTFDRSDAPEQHTVRVSDDSGNEMDWDEARELLFSQNRTLPMRIWIPKDKVGGRASGLFIYDVAIDLRALFSISLNEYEPELTSDRVDTLRAEGWIETANGTRLLCPAERRAEIIDSLAHSLVNWQITSNQSRTYSPQNTLAVAISNNANKIGAAIRADLRDDGSERPKADPVLYTAQEVDLFIALPALGYVRGVTGAENALEQAEENLKTRLEAFDYENAAPPPRA